MLIRRMISVPLLLLLVTTTGCAFFRLIDNSSPEEIEKFQTSKDDLWNQKKALEKWKIVYQQRLADQQEEIARMSRELNFWQIEIAQADKQVAELYKTVDALNAQLKPRQESTVQASPPPPKETGKEINSGNKIVKIKVLAGDGKIASARSLAKRLGKLGYRVTRVDQAPRPDFKVNTVFFGTGNKAAAAALAKHLGKNAVIKPLSWPSIFNIIAVTGSS
jgi:hypothetical protein